MKKIIFTLALAFLPMIGAVNAETKATVGSPAPEFAVPDQEGKNHSLAPYKGKYVVLEWFNEECPFVKKHYSSGNMQRLQEKMTKDGAVWLTVNSSAPGKQGHLDSAATKALINKWSIKSTATLLDETGKVGKLYGAKTTPHMYLIDPAGKLVYAGAIDDKPSPDAADIPSSKNLLWAAYEEAKAGKSITVATTDPYGCAVKYAS